MDFDFISLKIYPFVTHRIPDISASTFDMAASSFDDYSTPIFKNCIHEKKTSGEIICDKKTKETILAQLSVVKHTYYNEQYTSNIEIK